MQRHHRILAPAIVLLAAACGDGSGPSGEYHSASAEANGDIAVAAIVTVNATGYDSAFVRYWTGSEPPGTSAGVRFGGDTAVRVPVLGLLPGSAYTFEISVAADGRAEAVDTVTFTSGALPDWVPATAAEGTDTVPGFVILSLPGGAVAVDNRGRVVWYRATPDGEVTPNSVQAHANGRYTSRGGVSGDSSFHLLDPAGPELGQLTCVGLPTRFHDLLLAADGSAWLLCDDTRTMDLSAYGSSATAKVTATVVQHVRPDGSLAWSWNAFDHFEITDYPPPLPSDNVNLTHGNSIDFDDDGNLLLSFRSLNEVTSVDPTTGAVRWRFGGVRNEFTIVGDPKGHFERQHGVRWAGDGVVQLLDNGNAAPSRLVRYRLDETAKTATLEYAYVHAPDVFTFIGGSSQAYPDGRALVSFGTQGRVAEVDAAGNRLWEITGLAGLYVFRAQKVASLYHPRAQLGR